MHAAAAVSHGGTAAGLTDARLSLVQNGGRAYSRCLLTPSRGFDKALRSSQ